MQTRTPPETWAKSVSQPFSTLVGHVSFSSGFLGARSRRSGLGRPSLDSGLRRPPCLLQLEPHQSVFHLQQCPLRTFSFGGFLKPDVASMLRSPCPSPKQNLRSLSSAQPRRMHAHPSRAVRRPGACSRCDTSLSRRRGGSLFLSLSLISFARVMV